MPSPPIAVEVHDRGSRWRKFARQVALPVDDELSLRNGRAPNRTSAAEDPVLAGRRQSERIGMHADRFCFGSTRNIRIRHDGNFAASARFIRCGPAGRPAGHRMVPMAPRRSPPNS